MNISEEEINFVKKHVFQNPIYSCSADDCRFTHFLKTGINLHIKQAHDGQAQVEGEVTEDVKEQIKASLKRLDVLYYQFEVLHRLKIVHFHSII